MVSKYSFLYNIPDDYDKNDNSYKKNVVNAAAEVIYKLRKYQEIIVIAEMQSGKSEVIKRIGDIINHSYSKLARLGINIIPRNYFVVICASSICLKNQHQKKLAEIGYTILHLNDLSQIINNRVKYFRILDKLITESIIVFDECHCDAETGFMIDRFRLLLEEQRCIKKTNYKVIGFSATPYNHVYNSYPTVIMQPGRDYYGIRDMIDSLETDDPVLFQAKNLTERKQVKELLNEINIDKFYYIIRLHKTESDNLLIINNIESRLKKMGIRFESFIYDSRYKSSINSIVSISPTVPTLIYLKNKLRMGEYLDTRYVYLVHDYPKNKYTYTTIQSLLGRCCGYSKKKDYVFIFCDLEKAYEHYYWVINDYQHKYLPGNSKKTKEYISNLMLR